MATGKVGFGKIQTADDEFPRAASPGRPARPLNPGILQAVGQSEQTYAETGKHLMVSFGSKADADSFVREAQRCAKAADLRFNKTITENDDSTFTVRFYAKSKNAPEIAISTDERAGAE